MRETVNPCGNLGGNLGGNLAKRCRLPRQRHYPPDLTLLQGVFCQVEYTANSAYRFYHALD